MTTGSQGLYKFYDENKQECIVAHPVISKFSNWAQRPIRYYTEGRGEGTVEFIDIWDHEEYSIEYHIDDVLRYRDKTFIQQIPDHKFTRAAIIRLMASHSIPRKHLVTESIIIEAFETAGLKFSMIPEEFLTQKLVDNYCGGKGPISNRDLDTIYCQYSQYIMKNFPNQELSDARNHYMRARNKEGP